MSDKKIIHVAAAVIENECNEILLASRKLTDGRIFWEFPGGKIEKNESAASAARRELQEELALKVYPADIMYRIVYDYPDKTVKLNFVRCFCFDFSGMKMLDNQSVKWCKAENMDMDEILAADKKFVEFLKLRAINS